MRPDGVRLFLFDGGSVHMPMRNHIAGADPAEMVTTPVPGTCSPTRAGT